MSRLTKLTAKGYDVVYDGVKNKQELLDDCMSKLGKLEDIEEELGIDLVTLFKALKDGYYTNKTWGKEIEKRNGSLEYLDGIVLDSGLDMVDLDDYGKTWALTKEELEKCQRKKNFKR